MAGKPEPNTRLTTGPAKPVRSAQIRGRACLIQYSGGALGRRYYLDAPGTTIGRSTVAGIMIADDSVSREHVRCTVSVDTVEVEDMGSSNGTFVNDARVETRTPLSDGDLLRLGSVHFKFFAHNSIENVFHDEIYRRATIDAGTQLFNKRYLLDTLEGEFQSSRIHGRPLSVIYFDLDYFKKVNDTHGHNCGDFILQEVARIAKSCVRTGDTLGRYGGEDFVVVLPNASAHVAAELAERLRSAVETHSFVFEGKTLKQTISVGVSNNRPQFRTYHELLGDADRKLYQSKQKGRNRVTA
jgi:two-component system cell cycle response regulator